MNHTTEVDLFIDPFHKAIFKWFMNRIDLVFVYNSLDSFLLQQLTVDRISLVHHCTLMLYTVMVFCILFVGKRDQYNIKKKKSLLFFIKESQSYGLEGE